MAKSIGIVSLKGGVGKTSAVVALGEAIADFARDVLLIDGNLSAPNLGLHLNVINPLADLHQVLAREVLPEEAICKLGKFDLLPSAISRLQVNPFKLRDRVKELKKNYDVILMDSSPALNEETAAVMLASDEILVVTTPDYPTLSTTLQAVKMAKQRGSPVSGLILNKTYNKEFEIPIADIENTLDLPVLAVIPYDVDFLKSLASFTPFTAYKPESKAGKEYRKLAATLIGEKYKPFSLRNVFKLTPERQEVNREVYYERMFK